MEVSLNQTIRASQAGHFGGHIEVTVTCTNEDVPNLFNASSGVGFLLYNPDGSSYPEIHRVPPPGPDMGGPVPIGQSFERTLGFNTGQIEPGVPYILRCVHLMTGCFVENTFDFRPVYFDA